jgi:hypothetical protein
MPSLIGGIACTQAFLESAIRHGLKHTRPSLLITVCLPFAMSGDRAQAVPTPDIIAVCRRKKLIFTVSRYQSLTTQHTNSKFMSIL